MKSWRLHKATLTRLNKEECESVGINIAELKKFDNFEFDECWIDRHELAARGLEMDHLAMMEMERDKEINYLNNIVKKKIDEYSVFTLSEEARKMKAMLMARRSFFETNWQSEFDVLTERCINDYVENWVDEPWENKEDMGEEKIYLKFFD